MIELPLVVRHVIPFLTGRLLSPLYHLSTRQPTPGYVSFRRSYVQSLHPGMSIPHYTISPQMHYIIVPDTTYYYISATSMRRPLSYIQVPDAICCPPNVEWVLERTSFVFSQAKWHPSLTLTVSSCRHRPFLCYTINIHYITINHYMSSAFRVLQPLLQPYYYAYHLSFFTTTSKYSTLQSIVTYQVPSESYNHSFYYDLDHLSDFSGSPRDAFACDNNHHQLFGGFQVPQISHFIVQTNKKLWV